MLKKRRTWVTQKLSKQIWMLLVEDFRTWSRICRSPSGSLANWFFRVCLLGSNPAVTNWNSFDRVLWYVLSLGYVMTLRKRYIKSRPTNNILRSTELNYVCKIKIKGSTASMAAPGSSCKAKSTVSGIFVVLAIQNVIRKWVENQWQYATVLCMSESLVPYHVHMCRFYCIQIENVQKMSCFKGWPKSWTP